MLNNSSLLCPEMFLFIAHTRNTHMDLRADVHYFEDIY
jgi:hypothetical protein